MNTANKYDVHEIFDGQQSGEADNSMKTEQSSGTDNSMKTEQSGMAGAGTKTGQTGKTCVGMKTEQTGKAEKEIFLAGGCFWGMQKFFDQFEGVLETQVGYANGPDQAPTYQQVCSDSGHAETVRIVYDDVKMPLEELLKYFFMVIDPLSVNRQGNDIGIQYRTGIYYTQEDQLPRIEEVYRAEERKAGAKLAVELEPLKNFFPAEDYHQKYLDKNPGGYCHIPGSYFQLG